jgi:hypothetical protein
VSAAVADLASGSDPDLWVPPHDQRVPIKSRRSGDAIEVRFPGS